MSDDYGLTNAERRIRALEAENKRLRAAVEDAIAYVERTTGGVIILTKLRAALAEEPQG